MDATLERIGLVGVIPVVVMDDPRDAPALLEALAAGGLPMAEITFRTAAAAEAIAAATRAHPDALIGAGSVLTPEQVDAAVDAGARFVVSPGLEATVVERTRHRGATPLPGCSTASDLMHAWRLGLDTVKFFPSEPLGGLTMLRALAAPFPGMRFVPTGGVGQSNLESYLAEPRVLAVGGSWMVPRAALEAREWAVVTGDARAASAAVRRARASHP